MSPLQATDRATASASFTTTTPATATAASGASRLAAPRRGALAATGLATALLLLAPATGLLRLGGAGDRVGSLAGPARVASIPAAARAAVSAALGAAQPAFHIHATGRDGSTARNPAQGLRARFAAAGVTVAKSTLELHLSLRSVGFDASGREATAAVTPTTYSNRVTYARGAVSEWYANGPAGLEQGFTLLRAPAGARTAGPDAPLTVDLALAANARPRLAADGQGVTFRRGAAQLRYGDLLSTDASGRALRTWLTLQGGHVLIHVAAGHAHYPLRIDPLVQAGEKLTGGDEAGGGLLGASVALSADGTTMLVGGPHDENPDSGAAWVFVRQGEAWVQQGPKLTGAEPPSAGEGEQCAEEASEEAGECAFGASVALSADGDTALIGEPSATASPGSAWVFERSGSTWTRSGVLKGTSGPGEGRFGKSVALSADGQTALIGDPSAASLRGSAWVFERGGSGWTVDAILAVSEPSRVAHMGRSVALSSDGRTTLIGGPGDAGFAGAAWVFTRGASSWIQQPGKLTGADEVGAAHFGKSVALSGDGTEALVGGLTDAEGSGAVWPFARTLDGSFVQQGAKLTGAASGEPHFGYSVALSGDGKLGAVGAPRGGNGGLVTVLNRSGSNWEAEPEQLAGSGALGKGWLGAAVAISQDGTVLAAGAPRDNERAGAAWMFTPGATLPPPVVTSVLPGSGEAGTTVTIKGENFTGAEQVFFDSKPATFAERKTPLTLEAVAPEGLTGTVDVTVKTPWGVSVVNRPSDEFHYTAGKGKNPLPESGESGTGTGAQATSAAGGTSGSGGVLGTTSAGGACLLSLRSKHLAVTGSRTVALRLQRTGAGACSGKLTLSFNRAKRGKRPQLLTIGTASFAMGSASSKVLKIDLNKAGRKLFASHGRRLNASLSVVRAVPGPKLARSASVRLTWKKTRKVTLGH
jgi:hypothetical protein